MKTIDEIFVEEYRQDHKGDTDLPCHKCSDEQIARCSKVPLRPRSKRRKDSRRFPPDVGCAAFKEYENMDKALANSYGRKRKDKKTSK